MTSADARILTARRFAAINLLFCATAAAFLVWLVYFHESPARGSSSTLLPALNAVFNSASALCLAAGLTAIKRKRRNLHRALMLGALTASVMFLANYIYYHYTQGDTPFTGSSWIRPVYFGVLISHIVLSVVVLPMILWALFLALTRRFRAHKRFARWTWGLWMYVSVTGVAIFFMLHGL